jgi:hypothetical protein
MLEGRLSLLAGSKWSSAGPGETVFVPAGVRHAYYNKGKESAHVVCHARPRSTLQEFLEDAAALGRAGKLTKRGAFPKSFEALLQGGSSRTTTATWSCWSSRRRGGCCRCTG